MNHSREHVADASGAPAEAFTREATYAATRRPVDLAQTLTPEAYTSEAFFAVERERVFGTSWVAVGCSAQVREPGDVLVTEVAGRSIFVVRKRDGQLRAFYNACRHRGTQLLTPDECRVKRFIRCPYHSWAYDLDGTCVGTPLFTGSDIPPDQQAVFDMEDVKEFDRADYGLLPVAVDTWGPLVFVNLDPDPAPLSEDLGDLPARTAGHRLEEWEIARVGEYEIAANYKLVAENFMEYYHLPWVHPGLVKVSPIDAHHRWQGPGMYSGFCTTPIAQDTEEGGWGSGLPPIGGLDASDAVSARFIWLFPNVAVNILPNHVFIILARATSPRIDARDDLPAHASRVDRRRGTPSRPSSSWRASGTRSTARTSRSSSGCSRASTRPPSRAAASATGSRSRSTASRTWSSTAWSASAGSPRATTSRPRRCSAGASCPPRR